MSPEQYYEYHHGQNEMGGEARSDETLEPQGHISDRGVRDSKNSTSSPNYDDSERLKRRKYPENMTKGSGDKTLKSERLAESDLKDGKAPRAGQSTHPAHTLRGVTHSAAMEFEPAHQGNTNYNRAKPALDSGNDDSIEEGVSELSARNRSQVLKDPVAEGNYRAASRNVPTQRPTSVAKAPPRHEQPNANRATPTKHSSSILQKFGGMIWSSPSAESASIKSDLDQQLRRKEREIQNLREALHTKDEDLRQLSQDHSKEVDHLTRKMQQIEQDNNRKWKSQEGAIERHINQMQHDHEESIRRLQIEARQIKSERDLMEEKCEAVIREQQEDSFRRMESGRWLPSEESKVVADLDRVKRDMKSWSKATSIKDMSPLKSLDETDFSTLMGDLSHVVLLEDGQLPHGLSSPKTPSLLLNALLAHDVYKNLFRNPFFFLEDEAGDDLLGDGPGKTLGFIYHLMQESDQQEAHIWRSQTLRLLLPPLRIDSTDAEKELHNGTERVIAQVSERHASHFLAGSARHLMARDPTTDYSKKVKSIYQGAGQLSYRLWTRRTSIQCVTLHEASNPVFDIDHPSLLPHTLVRYHDHSDQLKGRPITVFVHPLLEAYGTDEAKDYDKGRVWAPAEVWLDSS